LRKLRPILWLALPGVVVALVSIAATADRLGVQGSYAQFHGDFGTRPVAGSSLGYGLLWVDVVLVLGIAWTCRHVQLVKQRR
ncbi:MAG TPA: hypothetical protein VGL13_07220, partial [Polyangiaceae bacterium]